MKKLFDVNQQLIADDFDSCYVFDNGLYELTKNNKISLFNAQHQLIAENLSYCQVFDKCFNPC